MPLLLPLQIPPEAIAQNQWAQLIALLSSETNVGPTGPGSGTNPNGRLQQIYRVHNSIDIWSGLFPAIAVQLMSVDEVIVATHRHDLLSRFQIRIAAASTPKTAAAFTPPLVAGMPVPANLDDAMAQLSPIISDGQGRGLTTILRDRLNFNLANATFPNGLAYQTDITGWKYDWQMDAGGTQETVIAYVTFSYTARARITI
jgi:hypothetical protein